MASQNRITKLILAGLLITALTTATAAASIQTAGGNDIVWQNSDVQDQLTAQCGSEEGNITSVTISGSELDVSGSSEISFSSSNLDLESVSWDGSNEVSLDCDNRSSSFSDNITFAEASVEFRNHGSALLNERLEEGENSEPIIAELSAEGLDLSVEEVSSSSFGFSDSLSLEGRSPEVKEASGSRSEIVVTLNPAVQTYADGEVDLEFSGSGELSGLETAWNFQPEVYRWSWEHQQTPPSEMDYEEITDGDFVYHTYLEDLENSDSRAIKEQFVLTVRERGEDWDSPFKNKEGYEKLEIIEKDLSDVDGANYRIDIGDTGPLNELPPGTYEFDLEFRYPEMSREPLLMDRVQVDKTSEFSGQVLDSGGNGVETSMALNDVESSSTQNVNAGSDGIFSTDINNDVFDINASFGSQPYSRVSMSDVDLASSTGPESVVSSIGSEYWNDPSVSLDGLRAVNMMAVKFGYPMENVRSLDMAFDSGQLDPKDMKVYECSEWNFRGSECMASWTEVPENDISIDYASWRVSINNADLYSTEDGDILMNSYVVGTSSKLSLQESIRLESSEIKHNGELKASGVLVSESGDRVSDAEVEISLVGDNESQTWTTSTDSTGSFEFSEGDKVNLPDGNYKLELTASKSPYESFEMTSKKTVEIYYETGLRLEGPTSKDVVQGNASTFEYTLSNTGQQPIEDISVDVSSVESNYYTLRSVPDSLNGEEQDFQVILELPGDYCNLPCGSPPQLDVSISGTSNSEEVSDSLMTSIVLSGEPSGDQSSETSGQQDETPDDSSSETDDSGPESGGSPMEGVREMTGDFVEKQGELNIALGLIFIFTMMLALSVKKKNSDGGDRRSLDDGRSGGRPSFQRPPINSEDVHEVEAKEADEGPETAPEEESESEESEDTEEAESSSEGFKCSVCGEAFESESGRDLHEEAVH